MTAIRILILSIGSLVGHNVMQVLAGRREHVFVIGANSAPEAESNFLADVTYLVPPAEREGEYAPAIERIIAAERPDLVIPTRDDDVLALARMKDRFGGTPAMLAGSVAAAEMMNDKKRTADFAARHGLPFAPTVDALGPARQLAASTGFPLIGKPRRGHGTRGVTILRSEAELERAFSLRNDLVVQPFLDFRPERAELLRPFDAGLPFFFSFPEETQYAAEMIIAPDGSCSPVCAIRSVQVGGKAVRNERVDHAYLIDLARNYAKALNSEGWVGALNIQAKRIADGAFVPFEANGRFSGGTAARTMMGFDEVGIAIRAFLPGVAFPGWPEESCNVVLKSLTSFAVPSPAVEQLARDGTWKRS